MLMGMLLDNAGVRLSLRAVELLLSIGASQRALRKMRRAFKFAEGAQELSVRFQPDMGAPQTTMTGRGLRETRTDGC